MRRVDTKEVIQKTVHFVGGEHVRNSLGKLGRGDKPRGILLHPAFAHTKLEEGSEGCKLSGYRRFLELLIIVVTDELANNAVIDVREGHRLFAWRCEKSHELLEVTVILADGVGRSVALKLKVTDELVDVLLH